MAMIRWSPWATDGGFHRPGETTPATLTNPPGFHDFHVSCPIRRAPEPVFLVIRRGLGFWKTRVMGIRDSLSRNPRSYQL